MIDTELFCHIQSDEKTIAMDPITVGTICAQLTILNFIINANNLFDFDPEFEFYIHAMTKYKNENILTHTKSKKTLLSWLSYISNEKESTGKTVAVYINALLNV